MNTFSESHGMAPRDATKPLLVGELPIFRSIPTKFALALFSAILLVMSLPALDFGWLAWFALVPLMIACHGSTLPRAAALGFGSGVVAAYGIYHWIFVIPSFTFVHSLFGGAYLALPPCLWCLGIAFFTRRKVSLVFAAPALWVVLDYCRAHAGFLAFPWATLAHTQHSNLAVLQVASITGEYGVTLLVVLENAAIAAWFIERKIRPVAITAVVIALAYAWGLAVLHDGNDGPALRVAAIQPNIADEQRETPAGREAALASHERLTRIAAQANPALIVWPETAVPGNFPVHAPLRLRLEALTRSVNIPIILGVSEIEKFHMGELKRAAIRHAYNSAYLFAPNEPPSEPYEKRALVPFGEYVPLTDLIEWPEWFVRQSYQTVPGSEPHLFTLPSGTKIGTIICWENLFSGLVRDSVRAGAPVMVQLTNDASFGRTEEPWQHNLASILRAVENRVPIVIASNTGPSEIIDAYGRTVASVGRIFVEGVAAGEVRVRRSETIYTRFGDVFVWLVAAALIVRIARIAADGSARRRSRM